MYKELRNILFKMDPEKAHTLAEFFLKHIVNKPIIQDLATKYCSYHDAILENEICGLNFNNPVGIGAGFDKNCTMIDGLTTLGFGYLELGTITKKPQSGNPKPRLFRHIEEESIQNAMGFNNAGSLAISSRLKNFYPYSIPLGINLGKNKDVAQEDALQNYQDVLKDFIGLGDYFVFNLSSPNTPNLRDLQNITFVDELFSMAKEMTDKPLFLKVSPDMEIDSMLQVCQKAIDKGASGIIATNTTIDYTVVKLPKDIGGISGKALKDKSFEILKILARSFFKKTTLISVGGIADAQDVYERMRHGASLVQIYSSFIFEGPCICRTINKELAQLIRNEKCGHISEIIGIAL